jgi:hypothetical protein
MQHALAANALRSPALALKVELLANAICGDLKIHGQLEQARDIAESQLLLTRARAARFAAMESLASIMKTRNGGIIHSGDMKPKLDLDLKGEAAAAIQFETFQRALAKMKRFDRYERRASSRRQQAIRALVARNLGSQCTTLKRKK